MSPVRWLRAVAVIGATALLMASSCSWQLGTPIPEGVPPPAGRPGAQDRHPRQGQARRSAARMGGRTRARARHPGRPRWRPTPTRPGSPRWRTPTAIWPGRRWPASGMVESHHGTYRGATIAPNGDVRRRSGASGWTAPRATWRSLDTDGGELDGDPRLRPGDGPDAVHPRDVAALRRRRQQRRRRQPGQHRRRRAVGGRLSVLARQGPGHADGAGWRRCGPTTCPTSTRARCGTGRRPTPTATPL